MIYYQVNKTRVILILSRLWKSLDQIRFSKIEIWIRQLIILIAVLQLTIHKNKFRITKKDLVLKGIRHSSIKINIPITNGIEVK